jgi:DNA-binding CsgD family transcriptional regulator
MSALLMEGEGDPAAVPVDVHGRPTYLAADPCDPGTQKLDPALRRRDRRAACPHESRGPADGDERTGARLRESIEGAVRVAMGDRRRNSVGSPNPARQFEIGHERYHVTMVMAGTDVAGQDLGAMITIRREVIASPPQVSEHALVRRFHLTPQEARVAILLADQRSNRDIAASLGVSVHTARHHTERVLAKLEIHSRHDVRKAIAG